MSIRGAAGSTGTKDTYIDVGALFLSGSSSGPLRPYHLSSRPPRHLCCRRCLRSLAPSVLAGEPNAVLPVQLSCKSIKEMVFSRIILSSPRKAINPQVRGVFKCMVSLFSNGVVDSRFKSQRARDWRLENRSLVKDGHTTANSDHSMLL